MPPRTTSRSISAQEGSMPRSWRPTSIPRSRRRMVFHEELEADAFNLLGHLRAMAGNLRKLTPEHWDWTYAPPAPTPRVIAIHTLAWLQCDRQHILNPDVTTHSPVPEPPTEPEEICRALEREADEWEH